MARAAAESATSAGTASGAETRERILHAALAAFSEQGFDGASTRDIATRADVNLGLIQYHFGGKDKLWRAAVDRAFAQMREGLDQILHDTSIRSERERFQVLIRAHVRFAAENRAFLLIMHDEGKRKGPRMRWLVDRHVRPLYERIRQILETAQAAKLIPADIDPIHFHYILVGSIGLYFHQAEECKRLSGKDPTEPSMVEGHIRAVEYVLLGADPEPDSASDPASDT